MLKLGFFRLFSITKRNAGRHSHPPHGSWHRQHQASSWPSHGTSWCQQRRVRGSHHEPDTDPTGLPTRLGPRQSRFNENSPFFAGLRGGGEKPVENLFQTGKTKAFRGAAMGGKGGRDNASTSAEPNNPNWGLPPSPPSAGGTGSWEEVEGKGKLFIQDKHSFPPTPNKHHKQDQTPPSRVFPSDSQLSAITRCKN